MVLDIDGSCGSFCLKKVEMGSGWIVAIARLGTGGRRLGSSTMFSFDADNAVRGALFGDLLCIIRSILDDHLI